MHDDGSGTEPAHGGRSALIGRDEVVEHVTQLVRRPDVRVVTITGRSGVGKSAVAAVVAATIAAEDGVGIARVQLDRHASRAGADEVAAALSSPSEGPAGPAPIGRRRMVLLDGLEAVSGASSMIADALEADGGLTVLVTSIVPLSLPGEQLVGLPPLVLPDVADRRLDAQRDAPAVRLLSLRIEEATGGVPEARELMSIVALARLLDGVPLALELAAARCGQRSVREVLEQVERLTPVGALTDDAAHLDSHHRSLRSTILWSYELLDDDRRRSLRRLGVFAGSFDRAAAIAVTEGRPDDLDVLVATCLARAAAPGGPASERFELLPSVSLVARELLEAEDELTATADRHADHVVAAAAAASPELRSAATPDVRRRILADLDDILAAVRHLDRRGRREDALRLLVDIALVWEESFAAALAAKVVGDLLPDLSGDQDLEPATAAEAWALAAMVAVWGQRSVDARVDLHEELIRAAVTVRSDGSMTALLMVLRAQVASYLLAGRPEEAAAAADEGLAEARELGDTWWICQFLGWCAASFRMARDPAVAVAMATEGQQLALADGDTAQLLRLSHILIGVPGGEADVLLTEGELIVLARRVGDAHAEALLHAGGAIRCVTEGDVAGAAGHVLDALDLGRRHGLWYLEEIALLVGVVVAAGGGRPAEAARLHGALTDILPLIERAIAPEAMLVYRFATDQARAALGGPEFDRTVARGRLLDWEDAVALGTVVCDELALGPTAPAPLDSPLSPRQAEVLALLALGRTNKEIATDLGMRPKTVMHHTSEIYRRLDVRNRTEAVGEARRLGVLDPSG